ncbi:MAG: 3'-5' exonuclease [Elusimicrobiaceae bacterium]|nr:3'-5' exonuclease [Elusimicrobiaceae bacterium]MBP5617055.1 3'-5' exonuclease [Elusimicrobiaceae bacterium]
MLLTDVKFACLDTETTGLSPEGGGKICEVAVSVSKAGHVLSEFTTLINPGMPMHPDVIAIHGITNDMVKNAPAFSEVLPKLLGVLDNCVVVAHNADFDIGFLQYEFEQCGMHFPKYPVVDTLKLARKSGRFEKNRLGFIAQQLGINCDGWHRAMADVKMTEQIFYYFLMELAKQGVTTLEQLNEFQCKRWKDLARTQ